MLHSGFVLFTSDIAGSENSLIGACSWLCFANFALDCSIECGRDHKTVMNFIPPILKVEFYSSGGKCFRLVFVIQSSKI